MHEYAGHMHIHSTHSDGSGTIPEIAAAARDVGLDFLVITDHNSLGGRLAGEEGFLEGVLVLIGLELEVQGKGQHCLVLGLREIPPATPSPEKFLEQIGSLGGTSFLAHPFELGSPILYRGRAFTWKTLPSRGFDGLEIWNYSSRWRDSCPSIPRAFLRYYLKRPGLALSPCPLSLKTWDRLSQQRPVSAVAGSDAHAVQLNLPLLRPVLFPYRDLFRGVNMHIYLRRPLSPTFSRAEKQVVEALKRGNSFVAYDGCFSSRGFRCFCQGGGSLYLPGEAVPLGSRPVIQVESPASRCLVKVMGDGKEIAVSRGPRFSLPLERAGVYRVEAYLTPSLGRPRPWVYTNPFYVK